MCPSKACLAWSTRACTSLSGFHVPSKSMPCRPHCPCARIPTVMPRTHSSPHIARGPPCIVASPQWWQQCEPCSLASACTMWLRYSRAATPLLCGATATQRDLATGSAAVSSGTCTGATCLQWLLYEARDTMQRLYMCIKRTARRPLSACCGAWCCWACWWRTPTGRPTNLQPCSRPCGCAAPLLLLLSQPAVACGQRVMPLALHCPPLLTTTHPQTQNNTLFNLTPPPESVCPPHQVDEHKAAQLQQGTLKVLVYLDAGARGKGRAPRSDPAADPIEDDDNSMVGGGHGGAFCVAPFFVLQCTMRGCCPCCNQWLRTLLDGTIDNVSLASKAGLFCWQYTNNVTVV